MSLIIQEAAHVTQELGDVAFICSRTNAGDQGH